MNILFVTSHFGFLRNFEFAIRALASRGHRLRLVADRGDNLGGSRTVEALCADFPDAIAVVPGPKMKDTPWLPLGSALRLTLDYWHYLHPRYAESPKLTARAAAQAPGIASAVARVGASRGLAAAGRLVRAAERSLPIAPDVLRFLDAQRPDLLLITPLLYFGSQQGEYVRAARRLGIRSVLCVGSWDHLTTKGLVHAVPDRVVVWNDAQREEARAIHGIDPERVVVTGASAYDHWFTSAPSVSREAFCARVGLDVSRPFLLYLCSSPFIAPDEVGFVERWIAAIRDAGVPQLRDVGILVRPHPQNAAQWADVDLARFGNASVFPRAGANPVEAGARAEYFDSMSYSAAVVGVNTSGLIESAIVGRMVYTVLDEEFAGTQEGTLHFRHLQDFNGGLLHVARGLPSHCAQIADLLCGRVAVDEKGRPFVEAFIRPRGLDVPAAEVFADAVEREGRLGGVTPDRERALAPLWRAVLSPLAAVAQAAALRRREAARRQKVEQQFRDKDAAEQLR